MKMQGDSIISALVGLVGAVSNNGRTEQTDSVIREAFLCLTDADSEEEMVQKIHAEKFIIAPDCATASIPAAILRIMIWRIFMQQMRMSSLRSGI